MSGLSSSRHHLFEEHFEDDSGNTFQDILAGLSHHQRTIIKDYLADLDRDAQKRVEEAERRGCERGLREAVDAYKRQVADSETALSAALVDIETAIEPFEAERTAEARALLATLIETIAELTLGHITPDRISGFVTRAFGSALDRPVLEVRTHDAVADDIRTRMLALAKTHGYRGSISVLGDPAMSPSCVSVEWNDGRLRVDLAQLSTEIRSICAELRSVDVDVIDTPGFVGFPTALARKPEEAEGRAVPGAEENSAEENSAEENSTE